MTKAEYIAAFDVVKEAIRLNRLACMFLQIDSNLTSVFYSDSQGVDALSKNHFITTPPNILKFDITLFGTM